MCSLRQADTIPTDDRDRVRVLGIGLGIWLVVSSKVASE